MVLETSVIFKQLTLLIAKEEVKTRRHIYHLLFFLFLLQPSYNYRYSVNPNHIVRTP
jgi:hypothetical protein